MIGGIVQLTNDAPDHEAVPMDVSALSVARA